MCLHCHIQKKMLFTDAGEIEHVYTWLKRDQDQSWIKLHVTKWQDLPAGSEIDKMSWFLLAFGYQRYCCLLRSECRLRLRWDCHMLAAWPEVGLSLKCKQEHFIGRAGKVWSPKRDKNQRGWVGGGTAALGIPDTFILHRGQFQCVLKSIGIFSKKLDQAHRYVENGNNEKN